MERIAPGTMFSFPLPGGARATGRVLLDVECQCIQTNLIGPDSPLTFYGNSILVEVYKNAYDATCLERGGEILIPGIFVSRGGFRRNEWAVIGGSEVDPTGVDFPESVLYFGSGKAAFWKGELSFNIDLSKIDPNKVRCFPTKHPYGFLPECYVYQSNPGVVSGMRFKELPERLSLKNSDLRYNPEWQSQVYDAIPFDQNDSYFETALTHGFDLRRFY